MATMRLLGHYCIKWACHGCISATKSVTSMTHPHDDFNERKLARWYLHWKIKLFMLNCSISKKPLECCRTAIHCLLAPHFRKRQCMSMPSLGWVTRGWTVASCWDFPVHQEVNTKGSEIASRGAAPVGLAVTPAGQVVWRRSRVGRVGRSILSSDGC